jgi:hypothetical protein
MKKKYILALLIITISAVCTKVKAQQQQPDKMALSLGPELGLPINTVGANTTSVRDYYKDGFGGSLKLEKPVTTGLFVTVTAGYMSYKAQTRYVTDPGPYILGGSFAVTPPDYAYIPLKAGLRFYPEKYIYVEGQVGEAIKASSSAFSSFIYGGVIGGLIPINAHNSIDLGVAVDRGYKNEDYNYPMGQVAIRLAYRYNF